MGQQRESGIEGLSYREAVRRRPGMYIASTGPAGRLWLVLELLANAFDLVLSGTATSVAVTIHEDGSFEVSDDGPGLNLLDSRVRSWFADGHQRPTADGHQPHVHLTSMGVGAAVVNFLSSRMRLETSFDGQALVCEWTDGGLEGGTVEVVEMPRVGTSVRFWPDLEIFDGVDLSTAVLRGRLGELAALRPGLTVSLGDESWTFERWESGLESLAAGRKHLGGFEYATTLEDGTDFDLRMLLMDATVGQGKAIAPKVYANYREMPDEGDFHLLLRTELAGLGVFAREDRQITAVVSVAMTSPDISGPTRQRLADPRAVAALALMFAQCRHELERIVEMAHD